MASLQLLLVLYNLLVYVRSYDNDPISPWAPQSRPAHTHGHDWLSQTPAIDGGRARNTEYWRTWFKNRDQQENFVYDRNDGNYSNNVGYETDQYCIYDLRIHYLYGSPDGVLKRMIGFNGQFPGPPLYCTQGKTMIVRVTNDIADDDEPTSIHWHGIQQNFSPFYDGPQAITQCPIIRDNSMIYKFQVFQAGTYWYHSHHSYQYVDGAWGFLVIRNSPAECWGNSYDEERLISINDWTHLPARELSEFYLTVGPFPLTNSSLINGRGTFNCSMVEPGQTCNRALQGPSVIKVQQGKRYRFRILNSSATLTYNFTIDSHKMVVIETDGVDTVKSPKVDIVPFQAAQRYSVIVIADQPPGSYWIRISGDPEHPPASNAVAILVVTPGIDEVDEEFTVQSLDFEPTEPDYSTSQGRADYNDIPWDDVIASGGIKIPSRESLRKYFPYTPPKINWKLQPQIEHQNTEVARNTPTPTTTPVDDPVLLDQQWCPPLQYGDSGDAPAYYDRLIFLNMSDCEIPGSPSRLCMNGEPFVAPSIFAPPALYQVIKRIPVRESARPIYTPANNEVIRLVINNRHHFPHPWHLHGHSFWVMGDGATGDGDFDPARDNSKLITTGVRRDTTFTLPTSWAVVTYITDNPGVWILHCHINWHLEAGLGVTFIEGQSIAQRVYKIPPRESTQTCARVGVRL